MSDANIMVGRVELLSLGSPTENAKALVEFAVIDSGIWLQGPLLLTRFNFNPSMDK